MSTPLRSAAYPASFLAALAAAWENGEISIPCPNPSGLRLRFYGLRRALISEGKPELVEGLGFFIRDNPSRLIIKPHDTSEMAEIVAKALGNPSTLPAPDADEEAFLRIIGEKS